VTFLTRPILVVALGTWALVQWPQTFLAWRYAAPIQVGGAAGELASVLVPASVTSKAQRDWTDLRVVDGQGQEVPFVLRAQFGGTTVEGRQADLLEPTAVAGSYKQVVADTGAEPSLHNSLSLALATSVSLMSYVEVAVSTDLREWRVIRERAPIYVLTNEGRGQNTEVSYPDTRSRYLRVRVLDGTTEYAISAVMVRYNLAAAAERVAAPGTLKPAPELYRGRSSTWTSDADLGTIPISAVEFKTSQTSFSRYVMLFVSEDGERWRQISQGEITGPASGSKQADLLVEFPEMYARHWRVTVNHQNDAPIADLQPVFLTVPRRLVFQPQQGQSYRLLYGHPRALTPQYDLAQLTEERALHDAKTATLGAEEENTAWEDPTPFTERYSGVLWAALAAAAILLGVASVRSMKAG
jgi:hypothetical protein